MFGSTPPPEPALTPLPPRLSLRSSTPAPAPPTASSIFADLPYSPPARSASTSTFSLARRSTVEDAALSGWGELLSQDPRLSVNVRASAEDYPGKMTSTMALPGGGLAVAGQDAPLLINEMHRAHLSASQHRRRRNALWAGLLTLVVLGCTGWFIVETVWALILAGARDRGVVRWIDLAVGLCALHAVVPIIPWLRMRRPNRLSLPCLTLAVLIAVLHLSLAIANIVLAIVWRDELATRCAWGIDVAFTMGRSGRTCLASDPRGWIVAAAVRLIITVIIGFLWLTSLRTFYRCLRISSIIDPSLVPSSEARQILARHTADIVALSPQLHSHAALHGSDYLPPMPDRSAHYAWVSETNSWVPSEPERGKSAGVGTWLGAKVLGAVGWLMGIEPFGPTREGVKGDVEKGERRKTGYTFEGRQRQRGNARTADELRTRHENLLSARHGQPELTCPSLDPASAGS